MGTRFTHRLASVPHDTRIASEARSLSFPGELGKAVLLIHGFTGVPSEMKYLGQRLSGEGFAVSIPRLPGHGTNHRDLLASGARDWLRRCVDAYLELSAEFDTVYVAGLSMGGLLAVLLAAEFKVPRIVLAAPALRTTIPLLRLTPVARYFVQSVPNRAYTEAEEDDTDADRRSLRAEYSRYRWVAPAAELRSLQRLAMARLRQVQSATLTIVSKRDRAVPTDVGMLVERRAAARETRLIVLERSGHVVVDGEEKESVADEVIRWFKR